MSQKEYTFWQKWNEIQDLFPGGEVQTLWGPEQQPSSKQQLEDIQRVKRMIWVPKEPDDYLNLEVELLYVNTGIPITSVDIWGKERIEEYANPDPVVFDWRYLRIFVHTQKHGGTVGRSLNYLVRDKVTSRYLGAITVSGDFLDLAPRDDAIGWSKKVRVDDQRIQHTAIGSTILPTQPLGFNYVGGKLCALLCLSQDITKRWEGTYGKRLAGMTTTSLYGAGKQNSAMSQYDNLKHWKKLGYSSGSSSYQLL